MEKVVHQVETHSYYTCTSRLIFKIVRLEKFSFSIFHLFFREESLYAH